MLDFLEAYSKNLVEPPKPRQEELKVNKSDEFFIAICEREDADHSYIIAGVQNKKSKKNKILCAVGKIIVEEKFFSKDVSAVASESFILKLSDKNASANSHKISYKAFTIKYSQYLKLLSIFKYNRDRDRGVSSKCFIPARMQSPFPNIVKFIFEEIEEFQNSYSEYETKLQTASLQSKYAQNCRHTAIEILEKVLGRKEEKDIGPYFPGNFSFPYITAIKGNDLIENENFFIFPIPANKNMEDKNLLYILKLIYTQMESLAKKWQDNPLTQDKFDLLSILYNQIIEKSSKPYTLSEIINHIFDYENQNDGLIIENRSKYIKKRTGTKIMFDKIRRYRAKLDINEINLLKNQDEKRIQVSDIKLNVESIKSELILVNSNLDSLSSEFKSEVTEGSVNNFISCIEKIDLLFSKISQIDDVEDAEYLSSFIKICDKNYKKLIQSIEKSALHLKFWQLTTPKQLSELLSRRGELFSGNYNKIFELISHINQDDSEANYKIFLLAIDMDNSLLDYSYKMILKLPKYHRSFPKFLIFLENIFSEKDVNKRFILLEFLGEIQDSCIEGLEDYSSFCDKLTTIVSENEKNIKNFKKILSKFEGQLLQTEYKGSITLNYQNLLSAMKKLKKLRNSVNEDLNKSIERLYIDILDSIESNDFLCSLTPEKLTIINHFLQDFSYVKKIPSNASVKIKTLLVFSYDPKEYRSILDFFEIINANKNIFPNIYKDINLHMNKEIFSNMVKEVSSLKMNIKVKLIADQDYHNLTDEFKKLLELCRSMNFSDFKEYPIEIQDPSKNINEIKISEHGDHRSNIDFDSRLKESEAIVNAVFKTIRAQYINFLNKFEETIQLSKSIDEVILLTARNKLTVYQFILNSYYLDFYEKYSNESGTELINIETEFLKGKIDEIARIRINFIYIDYQNNLQNILVKFMKNLNILESEGEVFDLVHQINEEAYELIAGNFSNGEKVNLEIKNFQEIINKYLLEKIYSIKDTQNLPRNNSNLSAILEDHEEEETSDKEFENEFEIPRTQSRSDEVSEFLQNPGFTLFRQQKLKKIYQNEIQSSKAQPIIQTDDDVVRYQG